jgi:hypothetical protein
MFERQSNSSGLNLAPTIVTTETTDGVAQNIAPKRRGAVSGAVMTEEEATSYVKKVTPLYRVCVSKICVNLHFHN